MKLIVDPDVVEGFVFGGVGTLLAVLAIPVERMADAFFIGIAGGVGGLLVKLIQWKIKKWWNEKH